MAHNINYNEQKGKYSFFSVKEKPWHGLGQLVSDHPTSAEALRFAGLDFTVEKRKLFTYDNQNLFGNADTIAPNILVPNYYATIRTDTEQVLGVVGKEYAVVQNTDAFSFFDAIVGGDGIQYETAGALGKGERIFITAKLPDYIKVGRDDLIEKYLFLTTSHDGFGSITAAFTPVRIVCANTLNAALRNRTNCIKIRHTGYAKERLEQAHKVMGIANNLAGELEAIFNHCTAVRITDAEVRKLIQLALAPTKETVQDIRACREGEFSTCFANVCNTAFEYAMSNPTQQIDTTKGTLFGAYNAITGYYQNVRMYKDNDAKLRSFLYGGTAQVRTQKAFRLCEDFAKHGNAALHLN